MTAHLPQLSAELSELIQRATAAFDRMTPSEQLRHRYMQRRSFARGMAPWRSDYATHCAAVDKLMPHEKTLTDAQIGLILAGGPRV